MTLRADADLEDSEGRDRVVLTFSDENSESTERLSKPEARRLMLALRPLVGVNENQAGIDDYQGGDNGVN